MCIYTNIPELNPTAIQLLYHSFMSKLAWPPTTVRVAFSVFLFSGVNFSEIYQRAIGYYCPMYRARIIELKDQQQRHSE